MTILADEDSLALCAAVVRFGAGAATIAAVLTWGHLHGATAVAWTNDC